VEWQGYCNPSPTFDDENNLSLVLRLEIGGVSFLFPGDLECAGWRHLLATNREFSGLVSTTTVLMAAHHGRLNGICPELFDTYGCNPELVVISDDYRQFASQETTNYYRSKCRGIATFRDQGPRKVLTTRRDGALTFSWQGGECRVY
jgi:beta-lactamase superfamily II metal-dependent hydrolase